MNGQRTTYIINVAKIKRGLLAAIVVMILVMGYYILEYNRKDINRVKPAERVSTVTDADVVVHNVQLVEYLNERILWNLQAKEASVYSTTKKTHLQDVAIDFFDEIGEKSMHLISASGTKDDLTGDLLASGNVKASALADGITLETEELAYTAETEKISSNKRVRIIKDNIITEGEGLQSDLHLENVDIFRNVVTILTPTEPDASQAVIKANTLYLDNLVVATYEGHVVATHNNTEIQAERAHVYIDRSSGADMTIERIEVFDDVHVIQEGLLATGEAGKYLTGEQLAVLKGTPEKQARGENETTGQILEADVIKVFLDTGDIEGEGNVKILGTQGF
jgi:LPS export ABC transporter protein LptC